MSASEKVNMRTIKECSTLLAQGENTTHKLQLSGWLAPALRQGQTRADETGKVLAV